MNSTSILSGRTNATSVAMGRAAISILGLCTAFFVTSPAAQTSDTAKGKVETYRYFVFSNPVDGKEDEFNAWYDNQHAPDVVAVPGFVTAQRFVASDTQLRDSKLPAKYLVVYKVVTNDLPAVQAEVSRRLKVGMTVMSPTFAGAPGGGYYKVISPIVEHKGGNSSASRGNAQTYYQFVFSNPVAGKESEYNTWYDNQHVPDVVSVPGFIEGHRLNLASGGRTAPGQTRYEYLAMFKIVTDNLPSVFADFRQRAPKMPGSPAFGENAGYTYKTWGPLLSGDQVRADRANKSR